MKLSTRSRYGVRLMTNLAIHYGESPVFLKDIAKDEEISEKYLGQIIIPLKAKGFINTFRGAHGGYVLSKSPEKISLKDLVESLEGSFLSIDCLTDSTNCSRSSQCVTKDVWTKMDRLMSNYLDSITLADLVKKHKEKSDKIISYSI
jgi:Rrf2 family protein